MADKDYGPRIGADPELFVQDVEGKVIPICGKIGGTKEKPLIINHLIEAQFGPDGGRRGRDPIDKEGDYAIQEDNVMLEFNIPAYKERSNFQEAISRMMAVLEGTVLIPHNLHIRYDVMHTFKAEDIAPFPQALTIGCLSDMDAYAEGGTFERPTFSATTFGNHRFCGGHIHVQYNHDNVPRNVFAQFMDLFAELPFLRWDKQKMRRMFYGQPGLYREKPYGIEYRTTSNFWLSQKFRESHLSQLAENVLSLGRMANNGPEELRRAYEKIDWSEVQHAISTENTKLADDILEFISTNTGLYIAPAAMR